MRKNETYKPLTSQRQSFYPPVQLLDPSAAFSQIRPIHSSETVARPQLPSSSLLSPPSTSYFSQLSFEPSLSHRHQEGRATSISRSSSFHRSNPPTSSTNIHQRRSDNHPQISTQHSLQQPSDLLELSSQQQLLAPMRPQRTESCSRANAPTMPIEVVLYATTGAKECLIQWFKPQLLSHCDVHMIRATENQKVIDEIEIGRNDCKYSLKTMPGGYYSVEYYARGTAGNITAKGAVAFRATFSRSEMNQLLQKAAEYALTSLPNMHPFRVLYRCKPQCYWDDIQQRTNNMMIKYIKDENGQAANPINGNVCGLFFSARLLPNGRLPVTSPFGNIRMMIHADDLLNPTRVNMYFCDFYCNKRTHYVTVVVCVKGTRSDDYCKHKLLALSSSNPFITVIPGEHGNEFYVNKNVWVEIYWTENIPLCWGKYDRVNAIGMGTSRLGGLRHNKRCTACNLYPIDDKKRIKINNGSNCDEEEANDAVAKQSLEIMVASMNGCQLSKRECEDIVFLLNDLVDRVAYDTDMDQHGSTNVENQQKPAVNEHSKKKGGLASKLRNLRGAVTNHINRVQSTIVKKKNQLKNKFKK